MEPRRYYNRYQRQTPFNSVMPQVTVEDVHPNDCLVATSLAMVYAPVQCFSDLYEASVALRHGTLFKDLNKPFIGKRC